MCCLYVNEELWLQRDDENFKYQSSSKPQVLPNTPEAGLSFERFFVFLLQPRVKIIFV